MEKKEVCKSCSETHHPPSLSFLSLPPHVSQHLLPIELHFLCGRLSFLHAQVALLQQGLLLTRLLLQLQCLGLVHRQLRHQCHHFPGCLLDAGLDIINLSCRSAEIKGMVFESALASGAYNWEHKVTALPFRHTSFLIE